MGSEMCIRDSDRAVQGTREPQEQRGHEADIHIEVPPHARCEAREEVVIKLPRSWTSRPDSHGCWGRPGVWFLNLWAKQKAQLAHSLELPTASLAAMLAAPQDVSRHARGPMEPVLQVTP